MGLSVRQEIPPPFNPLTSHEGRLCHRCHRHFEMSFQSTSLSRGKTVNEPREDSYRHLSIHFPLTREDPGRRCFTGWNISFNPLPSHEGRPNARCVGLKNGTFQSTSLSRGKTRLHQHQYICESLSIHFPLTREDFLRRPDTPVCDLSIHFPLTREDGTVNVRLRAVVHLSIHFPLTREDYHRRRLKKR